MTVSTPYEGVRWAIDVIGARVLPVHGIEERTLFGSDETELACTCGSPHKEGMCVNCSHGTALAPYTDTCRESRHRQMVPAQIGKHPVGSLVHDGWLDASNDWETVERWWNVSKTGTVRKGWNCALVLLGSGVVVADVDGEAGEAEWAALVEECPALAEPTAVVSSGHGRHLYFRWEPGEKLTQRLHDADAAFTGKWPGCKSIDLRIEGYLIGPGSRHRNGRVYELVDPTIAPAAMPAEWADRLRTHFEDRADRKKAHVTSIDTSNLMDPELVLNALSPRQLAKAHDVLAEAPARPGRSEQSAAAWTALAACVVFSGRHDPEDVLARVVSLLAQRHEATMERWSEKPHLIAHETPKIAQTIADTLERREAWASERSAADRVRSFIPSFDATTGETNPAIAALFDRLERYEVGFILKARKANVGDATRDRNAAKRELDAAKRELKAADTDSDDGSISPLKANVERLQRALDDAETRLDGAKTALEDAESRGSAPTGADVLFAAFADGYQLCRDRDGQAIALPLKGPRIATPVGKELGSLLLAASVFSDGSGAVPSPADVSQALSALDGLAKEHSAPIVPVAARWFHDETARAIWLNLSNDDGEVVRVDSTGWEVLPGEQSPNAWLRIPGTMPTPLPGGNFDDIWTLANIGPELRPAVRAWLVSAAFPGLSSALIMLQGEPGSGKALSLATPIPTPTGWTTMGELAVGDTVIGRDGRPCSVTFLSDINLTPEMYDVHLDDGQVIRACKDHQWIVSDRSDRLAVVRPQRRNRLASWDLAQTRIDELRSRSARAHMDERVTAVELADICATLPGNRWRTPASITTALNFVGVRPVAGTYSAQLAYKGLACRLEQIFGDRPSSMCAEQTLTTSDMIHEGVVYGSDSRANFSIAVPTAVELPDAELLVDPYVLGSWLGNGGTGSSRIFVDVTDGSRDAIRMNDQDHLVRNIRSAGFELTSISSDRDNPCVSVSGLITSLKTLGVDRVKRIPLAYLRASCAQRFDLLQGLMDTDGTVSKEGNCELSLSDGDLAADAIELIRSLGIKASVRVGPSGYTNGEGVYVPCKDRHRIKFTTAAPVFRLPRKAERLRMSPRPTTARLYVTAIVPAPSEPARCISVDSPDRSYLCEGFVPTHNTTAAQMVVGLVDDFDTAVKGPKMLDKLDDILLTFSKRSAIVVDNVTRYTQETSDSLCSIVTGTGLDKRKLFTDGAVFSVNVRGALIVTGVAPVGAGSDLMTRTVVAQLVPPAERLDEESMARRYRELRPLLTGCVLDDISHVLRRTAEGFELPAHRRHRLTAYGRMLGILDERDGTDGLSAVLTSSVDQIAAAAMDDPVIDAFVRMVSTKVDAAGGFWAVDTTELTHTLATYRPTDYPEAKWPRMPRSVAQMAMQSGPVLRAMGYAVEKGGLSSGTRRQTLEFRSLDTDTDAPETPAPPASPAPTSAVRYVQDATARATGDADERDEF